MCLARDLVTKHGMIWKFRDEQLPLAGRWSKVRIIGRGIPIQQRRAGGIPAGPEVANVTSKLRITLTLLFAGLICLRMPDILLHGRFWAEEGKVFFAEAWRLPVGRMLFRPYGGYLNLVANAGAIGARSLVSVERAPYVTIALALVFQTCPAILILSSGASWLRSRWAIVAALLILATPPASEEVWLQTLHSQFHLAVCAGLILAMPAQSGRRLNAFRLALLVLGPLCGPACIVLLPFFVLRAMIEKSQARWWQTLALLAGSALQIGLFLSVQHGRSYHIDSSVLAGVMLVRHLFIPLVGYRAAAPLADWIHRRYAAGAIPWSTVMLSCASFAIWIWVVLRRWREAPAWLLMAGLAVAVLSYYGAIDGGTNLLSVAFGLRYSFAPQALMSFSLLALASARRGAVSYAAATVVCWLIAVGLAGYFAPSSPIFAHGPDWRREVAAWRADPCHRLAIWPSGWVMDLPTP